MHWREGALTPRTGKIQRLRCVIFNMRNFRPSNLLKNTYTVAKDVYGKPFTTSLLKN